MFTYYLILAVFLLLVIFTIHFYWSRRHLLLAASKIQGPKGYPIIGNALDFWCNHDEILEKIHHIVKPYYDEPARFWLGPKLLIAFTNPKYIEKILPRSRFAYKHDLYDCIRPFLGEGLVTGSGPVYKQHRRIIQPMLDLNFTHQSVAVYQKHVSICMENLEKYVDKGTFDYYTVISPCMIDIMKELLLGTDPITQRDGWSEFDQAMIKAYYIGFARMVQPQFHPNFTYFFTKNKRVQDQYVKSMRKYAMEAVRLSKQRRSRIRKENDFCPIIDRIAEVMEDNPESFSDEHFVDHLLTLQAASEDTHTIIGGFFSLCLGMYPEYQEKVAAEIREVFGETPRPVTLDDINKLKYLDMCFKDVLRLFPIAPTILRNCMEDFLLDEKWLIPKGCAIVVPIYTLHRDPRHWANPDHFHPDHFLPEEVNKRPVYSYIPFSAGPRGCIGKILANAGLKIFICNVLQRFEIEADGKVPDLPIKQDISTRPRYGYKLRLKRRVWK